MEDPSLTLTPAKRGECEVVTHPDEPPKRLHQSLPKDHGSDSDSGSSSDEIFNRYPDFLEKEGAEYSDEESDEEVGVTDEVRNSEEYKEYRRLIDQSEGYDCGSFNFPYFDYIIVQLKEERHQKFRDEYLLPYIDKYNKEENRKVVLDSIEKLNVQWAICCFEKYYVTFKVKDMDDGAALKTFQYSFIACMRGTVFCQFREKP